MAKWTPETPWVKSNKKTQAYWPPYVCKNPNCKSYGRSHPNCKCGIPSFAQQSKNLEYDYAGGEVGRHCESHGVHDESCEYFADGGTVQANQQFESNPNLAVDHSIVSHGLLHALTKLGQSKSDNLHRPTEDFLDHHHRGRKSLKSHSDNHFDMKHEHPSTHKDEVSALGSHLDALRSNPEQLLEMSGLPGLPAHSASLGAKAASAMDYFAAIKPQQALPGPLDPVVPKSKIAEQNYHRQLAIAEKPLSIMSKVRNGTIVPADLQTLDTIYPELAKSIREQAFESLVNAKTKGTKISYAHKMGLSFLLGQPLDATMTQPAMAAIMQANAGAKVESQGPPQKSARSGATEAALKVITKNDDSFMTPLEKIQSGK